MATKTYKIKVTYKGSESVIREVFGKTPQTALTAAKRMYDKNQYDYFLWELMDNGEWGYLHKIRQGLPPRP